MKTFKLISLQVIEEHTKTTIPLHDGLIIDQEDDYNRWIIEAFIDQKYKSFLKKMSKNENVILKVKITKESNKPATFQTTIAHITNIDHRMNVIFTGKIVNDQENKFEKQLADLIEKGYEGKQLLEQMKKRFQSEKD
ncbi:MAG TPA: YwpF family protein [Bacillota bacterium]|nr:YwpF family protein [Bacillota bacterium]